MQILQTFVQSIQGVMTIIVMIAVGYLLARWGWFNESATKLIARLVTQIALPAYMIATITKQFTAHKLLSTLPGLRFPVLNMAILFGISFGVMRALNIKKSHRGLFASMFLNSNTVFIGLPVNQALFGNSALPYVLVYYMANTTIFWTLGVYLIQRDGTGTAKFDLKQTLTKIFSPPLLGFMIGVLLVLGNIHVPKFLMDDFSYIGGLTIPLSMIFIGISMANAGLSSMRFDRDSLGILLGRFILAPVLMTLMLIPMSIPLEMKQVFILQSAMPVMTNAPVVSKLYGSDADYAAVMVTETTLLSLIVIPILMVIVQANFIR
ncbi:AEC family transporter [Lactiplantibacillus plantarum]|uniref:AEC family transporter n=1 Tax=Lactiplantibacillus plantarum TaxID=1590 RepID=UPI00039A3C76|nr:AEC family transporter [Lactiplantibacillus plantarum]AGL63224.2 AEC family malonate efflux carrier [Lactiplantibacillus plantarum subsp. plantarum P-8]MBR7566814.1 AEC family transporter [Lactiplantibacillus plantarum]MBR7622251.1 AEC family transporter [Lactiplantibacillus plantarum]MBR7626049.1 AEC family transporter [Lactiplantibacillus plantarum]MBR7644188.1 AEC family transporter [Lactiplantibacillus plantarum]